MNSLIHWSRLGLKLALLGFLALVAVALVMMVVVKPELDKSTGKTVPKERRLVRDPLAAKSGGAKSATFVVPADRIPKTQKARKTAPALTLLPNRIESDHHEGSGPENDIARIPAKDRRELVGSVSQFLSAWETFRPALPSDDRRKQYRASLSRWTSPEAYNDVVNRVGNIQPKKIGPGPEAVIGSRWTGTDMTNAVKVRYFDGDSAYVTALGSVRYIDALATSTYADPLHEADYGRAYGLLLRRSGPRWLVTRAVGDTLGSQ